MQDRYVGDVGDFGKYGLLRALCIPGDAEAGGRLSLGVVWYLVCDGAGNNDGKHVGYLKGTPRNKKRFGECDSKLWSALNAIVDGKKRRVESIEKEDVLPSGTVFFSEHVPLVRKDRDAWLERASNKVAECDVVFLDPDNGLACKSVKPGYKHAPKYVFHNEVERFWEGGRRSLVIYHHLGMYKKHKDQIKKHSKSIRAALGSNIAMHYHRGTARVFFIIPVKGHGLLLSQRACGFWKGPWGQHGHFDKPYPCE